MPNGSYTVTLSGAAAGSTTTNTSGTYIFSGLSNGTYTVTAGQPAGKVIVYNTNPKSATIDNNNATLNFTGSVCTKCTSGTVALADGTPVAGVSVSASNASATTDPTGLYILQPTGNGSSGVEGTIVPSMPGYGFTPGNRPCDRAHRTHQDFTAVPQGQGAVKEGSGLSGGSGKPGAGNRERGTRQRVAPKRATPERVLLKPPSRFLP
ncbi:MAG: SdrD B-like domain-containing protein [Acidobacteriota bacterium]